MENRISTEGLEMNIWKKLYMHTQCGDVATREEWRENFENMDEESWFGKESTDITSADRREWLAGGKLIEVELVNGEYVEV